MHSVTKFFFNIIEKTNNTALVFVNDFKDQENNPESIILQTGGIALPFARDVIQYFDTYNDKNKLKNIENFITALEVERIVIIYDPQRYGNFPASIIFTKICKKLEIYCISFVAKPFSFEGRSKMRRLNEGLELLDTDKLYIIEGEFESEIDKSVSMTNAFKMYNQIIYKRALEILNMKVKNDDTWDKIKYFSN